MSARRGSRPPRGRARELAGEAAAESWAAAPVASAPPPPPPPPPPPSRLQRRPGGRESRPRPPRCQSDPRCRRVKSQRRAARRGNASRSRPSAGACEEAPGPRPCPEPAGRARSLAPRSQGRGAARLEEAAAGPGLSMNRSHRHGAGSGCLGTMEVKSKVRGAQAGRSGRPDGARGLREARGWPGTARRVAPAHGTTGVGAR